MWIRRSAVCWRHATFAEVLACCRYLHVVVENRSQVGPGMAVLEALGHQYGSGTAVSGALGRLERPQGRPGVQKRTPNSTRIDAAGTKIDAKWALEAKKNELCQAAPSGISLGMFFINFWCFREVSEASEVPRLSAKTRVGPFAL